MGRVYAVVTVPDDLLFYVKEKLAKYRDPGDDLCALLELNSFAQALSMFVDPYYTGCEETFTDKLFDIEDLPLERQHDRLLCMLEDLVEFQRAKILDITRDRRCTAPKDHDVCDYDTAVPDPELAREIHTYVERFLPVLDREITADDVNAIRRVGILLQTMEAHYTGNRSGREDGVSACERFYCACDIIRDPKEAFLRALSVLYTAAEYRTVRVRRETDGKSYGPIDLGEKMVKLIVRN